MNLTETEKIILENTDKRCKYIARDKDGGLFAYTTKPKKSMDCWHGGYNCLAFDLYVFDHLFHSIQWEDEEPYKFR